jgi:hypothetical protein
MTFTSDNPILSIIDATGIVKYTATSDKLNDICTTTLFLGKVRFLMDHEPNCKTGSWTYTGDVLPTNCQYTSVLGCYFDKLAALGGNVDFSENQLDQVSVDLILNTLANLANYSNKIINLQDNAAPTALSAAAIAKLQSQGCIITHS